MTTEQVLSQATAARGALENSPIYCLRDISVSHDGDCLLLSGRVPSFYYKQLAQEAVRAVCEDAHVLNEVDVD